MMRRANDFAAAAFLFLCILIGGSGQNAWTNLALQLIGIALVAWAAIAPKVRRGPDSRWLDILLLVALVAVLAQLIPLPPAVWSELPGRGEIARGYSLLGQDLPSLPISQTPYRSIAALFAAIPAIAALVVTRGIVESQRAVAGAVLAGMVIAVILGALQIAGGPNSWAYLYDITNAGAVGTFANRNHLATLLLVSTPLVAALIVSRGDDQDSTGAGRKAIGIALLLLVVGGIAINGSLAGIALAIPVAIASLALVRPGARWRWLVPPVFFIALLAGIAVLILSPLASAAIQAGAPGSLETRGEIWTTAMALIRESFPLGTGLGSFEQVYAMSEDPADVTISYVNHAHNDYLQLIAELGAAGLLLIVLFLAWWGRTAVRIWASPVSTPFEKAATVATAAILAHSIVDFPLRTAAISAIFGALVAVMAHHRGNLAKRRVGDPQRARHVSLG